MEAAGEVGDEEVTVPIGDVPEGRGPARRQAGPERRLPLRPERRARRPSAAIPTATSSSTTSRCRAATPRSTTTGPAFAVSDVGSLNGTYLNRERIEQAELHNGDELQIGKFRLVFLHEMQDG